MFNPIDLFVGVLEEYSNHSKWDDAPLGKVKTISNTSVGSVGQLFVERLCKEFEIPVEFPINKSGKRSLRSSWDIRISGIEFELKTATEDVGGNFQFNHIRYHRKYQALMCLGVSPHNLYFCLWTKGDVTTGKAGSLVSMEKNANASYKLTKRPMQLHPIEDFSSQLSILLEKCQKET